MDGDGKTEIVQSGIAAAKNSFNNSEAAHDRAQLRVWGLSDGVLTLEQGGIGLLITAPVHGT